MLHTYGTATAADANTFTHARFAYRIRTIFFLVVLARVAAMTGYRNMYAPVKDSQNHVEIKDRARCVGLADGNYTPPAGSQPA